MTLTTSQNTTPPVSYLIFNNEQGWFLNINGETCVGPMQTYAEADKQAKIIVAVDQQVRHAA